MWLNVSMLMVAVFLLGFLAGGHRHSPCLNPCSPATTGVVSFFSFTPFRSIPEGGICV